MNWRDNPDSTYYSDWAQDYSDMKQTLAIDFDGVIHDRPKSERGISQVTGDPVPGAMHFLASVVVPFHVVIFSSRFRDWEGLEVVKEWMLLHMEEYVNDRSERGKKVAYITDIMDKINYDNQKPLAHVIIDDRAMTFTGAWPTIEKIMKFKTWSEQLQEL